jgi:hypothetical protein
MKFCETGPSSIFHSTNLKSFFFYSLRTRKERSRVPFVYKQRRKVASDDGNSDRDETRMESRALGDVTAKKQIHNEPDSPSGSVVIEKMVGMLPSDVGQGLRQIFDDALELDCRPFFVILFNQHSPVFV